MAPETLLVGRKTYPSSNHNCRKSILNEYEFTLFVRYQECNLFLNIREFKFIYNTYNYTYNYNSLIILTICEFKFNAHSL